MNIFQSIDIPAEQQFNYWKLFERIAVNRHKYEELFAKKKKKEQDYNAQCSQWRQNIQEI
jgi:hypothetical protein